MKKFWIMLLVLCLLVSLGGSVSSAPGDESDPVVSLSYLESVLQPQLETEFSDLTNKALNNTYRESFQTLCQTIGSYNQTNQIGNSSNQSGNGILLLKQDDMLTPLAGTKIMVQSGTILVNTDCLIDVTNGQPVRQGDTLKKGILYMSGDLTSGGLNVTSTTAEVYVSGVYQLMASSQIDYGSLATALDTMGLFQGTGTSYDLESSATRVQGLVMFLRILGEEEQALAYTGSHPFTDIPKSHWAYSYVAYAYHKGYTTGTSASQFTPNASITVQQYLTFLLRALGYQEGAQFTYASVLQDCATLGVFSASEVNRMNGGSFLRAKMVYLSYYGLFGVDQASQKLLMQKLVDSGAVSQSNLYTGICKVCGSRIA